MEADDPEIFPGNLSLVRYIQAKGTSRPNSPNNFLSSCVKSCEYSQILSPSLLVVGIYYLETITVCKFSSQSIQ